MTSKHEMTVYATDSRNMCGDKRKSAQKRCAQKMRCETDENKVTTREKSKEARTGYAAETVASTSTRTPAMWQNTTNMMARRAPSERMNELNENNMLALG